MHGPAGMLVAPQGSAELADREDKSMEITGTQGVQPAATAGLTGYASPT